MKLDFNLPSSDNKIMLSLHIEGNENAKAIVLFSHGMAEHKERYYEYIHFLNNHGYLCAIYDHRGHGDSVVHQDDYGYFYDDTGNAIIEDLIMVHNYLKHKFPNKKHYLFAHSMGTLVARNFIQTHDAMIDKLILCGPPYHNSAASFGYVLAKLLGKIHGDKKRSQFIHNIAFGTFDKKFERIVENEWINSDKEQIDLYNANPKCGYVFTNNGFLCLFYLMKRCFQKQLYQVENPTLPILFIAGSDDPVIGNTKQWLAQQTFLKSVGYQNISSQLYAGMRHELLNEKDKHTIFKDTLAFLNK